MSILTYIKNSARLKIIQASILLAITVSPIAYKIIVPKYDTTLTNTTSIYSDRHNVLDEILESNRRYTRRTTITRRTNNDIVIINNRTNIVRRKLVRRNNSIKFMAE